MVIIQSLLNSAHMPTAPVMPTKSTMNKTAAKIASDQDWKSELIKLVNKTDVAFSNEVMDTRYITKSNYQKWIYDHRVNLVQAAMGTGKSYSHAKLYGNSPADIAWRIATFGKDKISALVVSSRISLVRQMYEDLKEYDFHPYKTVQEMDSCIVNETDIVLVDPSRKENDTKSKSKTRVSEDDYVLSSSKYPRQVITIDSLHRVQGKFDLVFIDEVESVFDRVWQFDEGGITKCNRVAVTSTLLHYLQNAQRIVLADALMNRSTQELMQRLMQQAGLPATEVYTITNKFQPLLENGEKLAVRCYSSIWEAFYLIKESLHGEHSERFVLASSTKKFCREIHHYIRENFPDKKVLLQTKDTVKVSAKTWINYDIVIYSPTISAGISFDLPHFDRIFAYFDSKYTTAAEAAQMCRRARQHNRKLDLIVTQESIRDLSRYPIEHTQVEDFIDRKRHYTRSSGLFKIDRDAETVERNPSYHMFAAVMRRTNESHRDFVKMISYYLSTQGADVLLKERVFNLMNRMERCTHMIKPQSKNSEKPKKCGSLSNPVLNFATNEELDHLEQNPHLLSLCRAHGGTPCADLIEESIKDFKTLEKLQSKIEKKKMAVVEIVSDEKFEDLKQVNTKNPEQEIQYRKKLLHQLIQTAIVPEQCKVVLGDDGKLLVWLDKHFEQINNTVELQSWNRPSSHTKTISQNLQIFSDLVEGARKHGADTDPDDVRCSLDDDNSYKRQKYALLLLHTLGVEYLPCTITIDWSVLWKFWGQHCRWIQYIWKARSKVPDSKWITSLHAKDSESFTTLQRTQLIQLSNTLLELSYCFKLKSTSKHAQHANKFGIVLDSNTDEIKIQDIHCYDQRKATQLLDISVL